MLVHLRDCVEGAVEAEKTMLKDKQDFIPCAEWFPTWRVCPAHIPPRRGTGVGEWAEVCLISFLSLLTVPGLECSHRIARQG